MNSRQFLTVVLSVVAVAVFSQKVVSQVNYLMEKNIPYYDDIFIVDDEYAQKMCVLDLYYPTDVEQFPTIVWLHGGGLKGGIKEIPDYLKNSKCAIIGVEYRLSPQVKGVECIKDAAAAVAWAFKNIESYGGDTSLIFVSGMSAGGYLTYMVGLDTQYLAANKVDANRIAALIPFSGHAITHFTIRQEMGIAGTQPIIDNMAPLFYVKKDAPPMLIITGDRELEMLGRYEENAYMMRMLKVCGHQDVHLYELDGSNHGQMKYSALPLLKREVMKRTEQIKRGL